MYTFFKNIYIILECDFDSETCHHILNTHNFVLHPEQQSNGF